MLLIVLLIVLHFPVCLFVFPVFAEPGNAIDGCKGVVGSSCPCSSHLSLCGWAFGDTRVQIHPPAVSGLSEVAVSPAPTWHRVNVQVLENCDGQGRQGLYNTICQDCDFV